MKRRALFTNHTSELLGGAELSLLSLADYLQRDHSIEPVFVLPGEGGLTEAVRQRGWHAETFKFSFFETGLHLPYFLMSWKLSRLARRLNAALLHGNSLPCLEFVGLVGKLAKIPSVCHVRDIPPDWLFSSRRFGFFARNVSRIIAISRGVAKGFLEQSESAAKTEVVLNGIDFRQTNLDDPADNLREEFKIPAEDFLIGMASRLHPSKGHETAIRALKKMRESGVPGHLLISGDERTVGGGGYRERLEKLAAELGVSKHLTFVGHRPSVYAFLKGLDLMLLGSAAEPFGRIIVEAMAVGTPVMATDAGGVPEIITAGVDGILIPPESPEEWAKALKSSVENRNQLAELARNGRKTALEKFDVARTAREVAAIYAKIST